MEEKKHKRWNRSAKVSQFTQGAGGELVYTGRYYTYGEGKLSYRNSMLLASGMAGLMSVVAVVSGMMPVPALFNTWYVILPFLFTVIAVITVVWAICRIWYWGNPLREYVYDVTVKQVPARTVATMILSILTVCGQLWHLIFHKMSGIEYGYSAIFIVILVVIFLCALGCNMVFKRQCWNI